MGKKQLSTDEFIEAQRRKKRIKKICMLSIFLISVLVVLAFKLPYFMVKTIKVQGNKNILSKDIKKMSKIYKGNNIFYLNIRDAKKNILLNPYIEDVKITKSYPNNVVINIKERNAIFYCNVGDVFKIISADGCLLEKRNNIHNMKLVALDGLSFKTDKIGDKLVAGDNEKMEIITKIGDLLSRNKSNIAFTKLDLKNPLKIDIYYKQLRIKLGTNHEIERKLNYVINILKQDKFKNAQKGYIDVSYNGNPVVYIEK